MVLEFKGEYSWLSNFTNVDVYLEGIKYPSVEHAYMSAKSDDKTWKDFCSDSNNYAGVVKKKSRYVNLRKDWEEVKLSIMKELLTQKFNSPKFKELLLATENKHLQEGNYWGDTYWGVCLKTQNGKNVLGNLIMQVRKELKEKNDE